MNTISMDTIGEKMHKFESALEMAAKRSRLPFDRITLNEAKCFPELKSASITFKESFLYIRNKLLLCWIERCLDQLTLENCSEKFPSNYRDQEALIGRVLTYLERYGYINYGFYRFVKFYPRRQQRIIVLGAGIAGLTAARQLESFGCDTIVLEARHRTGGRMALFSRGPYTADLGAMVVTGIFGSPIAVLTKQMDLQLIKINDACPLFDYTGEKVMKEKDELIEKEFNRLLEACAYLAHNADINEQFGREFSLGETLEYVIKMQEKLVKDKQIHHWKTLCTIQERLMSGFHKINRRKNEIERLQAEYMQARSLEAPLDPQENAMHDFTVRYKRYQLDEAARNFDELLKLVNSLEETLRAQEHAQPSDLYLNDRDRRMIDWHIANLEFANSAPLDKLSLKYWDQDDIYEFGGGHSTVKGGYASIPLKLAEGLNIRYCSVAKDVKISSDDTEVIFTEGDAEHRIKADAVLCTLPLGVLKASLAKKEVKSSVKFNPPLPENKQQAINRLGFGSLNKVVLCFDRIFWDPKIHMFGYVNKETESRGEFFLFWTLYGEQQPVIISLIAGRSAEILETLPDQLIVERCLNVLRTIFSRDQVPTLQESVVTRWSSDPFSLGSYSYVAAGASGEDYDTMGEPVGVNDHQKFRLFFAGEHTCRQYPATVHGAIISGLREAGRIADAVLGPLNPSI